MACQFTKTEWEIIQHRLEVRDAIADALGDDALATRDQIEQRVDDLYDTHGTIPAELQDELTEVILRECCNGSTYFCGIEDAVAFGELSRGKVLALHKAAGQLEERLGVEIPR